MFNLEMFNLELFNLEMFNLEMTSTSKRNERANTLYSSTNIFLWSTMLESYETAQSGGLSRQLDTLETAKYKGARYKGARRNDSSRRSA